MIRRQLVPKTWSNHSAKSEMPPSTPWHTVGSHPNRKPLCETHTFEFLYMVVKLAALLFKFITEWSTSAWCMFSICFQGIEETWCYVINSCSVWLLQLHWDMTACLVFFLSASTTTTKDFCSANLSSGVKIQIKAISLFEQIACKRNWEEISIVRNQTNKQTKKQPTTTKQFRWDPSSVRLIC